MATIIEKATSEKVGVEPETVSDADVVRRHLDLLDSEFEALRQHLQAFGEAVVACDGAAEFGSCLVAELRRGEQPETTAQPVTA